MPAITPISVDQVGPPAFDVTFNPQQIVGALATYLDISGGIPLGYPKLSASLNRPTKSVKNTRVRIRMELPTLTGEPATLSHSNFADITYTFDEKSTLVERQTVNDMFMLILSNATLESMIFDQENLY